MVESPLLPVWVVHCTAAVGAALWCGGAHWTSEPPPKVRTERASAKEEEASSATIECSTLASSAQEDASPLDEPAARKQRWENCIADAQQRELDLIVEARDFFTTGRSGDDRHSRPPLVSAAAAAVASATSAAVHLDAALERRIQTFGMPSPRAPLSIALQHQSSPPHRRRADQRSADPWSWCSAALRRFAFGCAMHRRLGSTSSAHLLTPEIVREICDRVLTRHLVVVCGGIGYAEQQEASPSGEVASTIVRSSSAASRRPKRTWPWEEHEESDMSMARHHDDTTFDTEHSAGIAGQTSALQTMAGADTASSPQPSFEALRSTEVLELPSPGSCGGGGSAWEEAAEMVVGRSAPAVCKLPSGEILAIGGYCLKTREVLSSVEVFNPATGVWSSGMIPPLPSPRAGALAVVLPPIQGLHDHDQDHMDPKADAFMCSVLVCGGVGEKIEECLATTCLLRIPTAATASCSWKNASWRWEARCSMLTARTDHCGVLLPPPPRPPSPMDGSGRVAVKGPLVSVGARDVHVVVMGGFAGALDQRKGVGYHTARYGAACRSVELYCVGDDRWYVMPDMLEARQGCGAVLLPLPRILPMVPTGLMREQHNELKKDQATELRPEGGSADAGAAANGPQYWVCVGGGRGIGPVIGGGRGGCLRTVEAVSVSALLRNGRDANAAAAARDADEIEGWMQLRQDQDRVEEDPEWEMEMEAEEALLESDAGVQQLLVRAGVLPFVSFVWRPLPNMLRGRRDCQMLWTGSHADPWSAWTQSSTAENDEESMTEGGLLLLLGGQDGGGALLGSTEALQPSSVHGWRASWGPYPALNSPRREFGVVTLRL